MRRRLCALGLLGGLLPASPRLTGGASAAPPPPGGTGAASAPLAGRGAGEALVVHGDRSLPPYEFLEDGVAKGLNVDMFNALGVVLGRRIDYRLGDWGESQAAVDEGRGDVLPPLVSTAARRAKYNFTRTLWTFDFALFARDDDLDRVSRANRSSLRIGVTSAGFVRQYFVERYPSAQLVTVSDTVDGIRRLLRGEVDAYAGNALTVRSLTRDLRIGGVAQVDEPFASLEGSIAVHRRNPALHAELDAAVGRLKADRTLDRLIARWAGSDQIALTRGQVWGLVAGGVGATAIGVLGTMFTMQRRRAMALEAEVAQRRQAEALLETARSEAESARSDAEAARAAAESATRAKSVFLANMSHEIRTPMNAIVGLSRLIRRSPEADENTERLLKIDNAAQHLAALVSDVLDHSKIEAGKLVLDRAEFSLSALLQSVYSHIAVLAEQKGIPVVVEGPNDPSNFIGDPTRLRQALINLAANAVKFTSVGHIAIRGRVIAESGSGATLLLEVEDTGPGIDPSMAERLFEPFEQADAAVTRRHGGTGLGLSITRRLAELMGGKAGVESRLGQGSRFWFTAEVGRGPVGPYPAPSTDGKRTYDILRDRYRGARILVAEDNPVNLEVARSLLEDVGMVVIPAGNGREAVDIVGRERIDLVLMDMQMPEMDGMAATIEIRRRWPDTNLPILAFTANAFDEDRRACLMVGMNGFASKPLDPDLLYELLLKWLGTQGALAATAQTVGAVPQPVQPVTVGPPPASSGSGAPPAIQALLGVQGLDAEAALRRFGGNVDAYGRLLHLFVDDVEAALALIERAIAAGDRKAAGAHLHRLRGGASELGATAMGARWLAFEGSLRSETVDAAALKAQFATLAAEVQGFVGSLRAALTQAGLADPAPIPQPMPGE